MFFFTEESLLSNIIWYCEGGMEEKWGEEPQAAMPVQGQLQGRHDQTLVLMSLVCLWLGTSLKDWGLPKPGSRPRGCRWRPVAQCTPHCPGQDTGSSSKADVSCASEASLPWVLNPAEHLSRVWLFALCTRHVQGSTRTHVWGVRFHRASSLRMTHVAFSFFGSVCERRVKISSGGFTVINLVPLKGSACGTERYY